MAERRFPKSFVAMPSSVRFDQRQFVESPPLVKVMDCPAYEFEYMPGGFKEFVEAFLTASTIPLRTFAAPASSFAFLTVLSPNGSNPITPRIANETIPMATTTSTSEKAFDL